MLPAALRHEVLRKLAREHWIQRLDLFGSAAPGPTEAHDYDFLVAA